MQIAALVKVLGMHLWQTLAFDNDRFQSRLLCFSNSLGSRDEWGIWRGLGFRVLHPLLLKESLHTLQSYHLGDFDYLGVAHILRERGAISDDCLGIGAPI